MGQCATRQNRISSKSNASTTIYAPKIEDFIFLQLIGKGGFSKVWKVQEKQTQRIYALKVMDKAKIIAKKSINSILMERNILSSLLQSGCGQIAKIRAAFQDKHTLYLLLDYFEGHSLREHLNRGLKLDEPQISTFGIMQNFLLVSYSTLFNLCMTITSFTVISNPKIYSSTNKVNLIQPILGQLHT